MIIHVIETGYDIRSLYSKANTPKSRALVGYMVRKGYADDLILGGALRLLHEVEKATERNLVYNLCIESAHAKEIIQVVDLCRQGYFDKYSMTAREIRKNRNLVAL